MREPSWKLRTPWWFKLWTAFCVVLGLATLLGLAYLGYLAALWLQAHTGDGPC